MALFNLTVSSSELSCSVRFLSLCLLVSLCWLSASSLRSSLRSSSRSSLCRLCFLLCLLRLLCLLCLLLLRSLLLVVLLFTNGVL